MAVSTQSVAQICAAAKSASRELGLMPATQRNAALLAIADALESRADEVIAANARDLDAGRESGLDSALMDRLMIDESRLAAIASDTRNVAALDDPAGELLDQRTLGNGLRLRRVAVPLGLVAVVYEARPNVTIDATSLCIKSGNAIVLRGSSMAANSNAVMSQIAREAAAGEGLPPAAISIVTGGDRDELRELATQDGVVDLIIPRGGKGLKASLEAVATVPVIYAAAGNCHVFVDATADLDNAIEIIVNAKTQRPGVCNAAETLLVHADVAADFLPRAAAALTAAGVELRGDERARAATGDAIGVATGEDWDTEYLDLILTVGVVDDVDQAIDHINTHGTGHSEAILTHDDANAERFVGHIDSAAVYVNASTRFTDGAVFGLGAEIGISTQKLHARGPIGLRELCTYKYIVEGEGQIRG
jgi:glutamate-5-semialdehyde dehydrogenase